jgi:GH18 family chitinase
VDDPDRRDDYRDFTSNQENGGPKTFIAIGGFDFSNEGGDPGVETNGGGQVDTHRAWSNMASSSQNRQTFINSLISFMENYHFQGKLVFFNALPQTWDQYGRLRWLISHA